MFQIIFKKNFKYFTAVYKNFNSCKFKFSPHIVWIWNEEQKFVLFSSVEGKEKKSL